MSDPDRALWEIYVFHEDIANRGQGMAVDADDHDHDHDDHHHDHVDTGADADVENLRRQLPRSAKDETPGQMGAAARTAALRAVWTHRLSEPVPSRLPHDDNSLQEVLLEGSINLKPDAAHRSGLFAEALRALRPAATLQIHGLAGDRPCPRETLALPGPAADVQYVPTAAEVGRALLAAGFVDVRVDLLSETAYFVVDGVSMRELRMTARKPGHRPKAVAHRAVYLGPLQEVTDDFGNVFRRGETTLINVHDWQVLSKGAARDAFLLLPPDTAAAAPASAASTTTTTATACCGGEKDKTDRGTVGAA